MNTDAITGKTIRRSLAIENLLREHYPAAKGSRSLHAAINSIENTLPAILVRTIRVVAIVRNADAHPDGFKPDTVPSDFDRLCDEIELLIPYFAKRQISKPPQPPKKKKPPTSAPQTTAAIPKPEINSIAANLPANHGKPWTPEEDKRLTDAFDAQTDITELAKTHERGVGGIQNRLIKLGRLSTDEYKIYPPEPQ
jgi:hypothetical protein